MNPPKETKKMVLYQLLVRLAGNSQTELLPFGSREQNGCGTFKDLTRHVLQEIRALGATHLWLTGVLRHASCTDYSSNGIPPQDPRLVKGVAGSPYAVTDYYDVSPDLAEDVEGRMQEFEQLLQRCRDAGLQAIIDFVPNHVARQYHSICKPTGVRDLGEGDDKSLAFSAHNNFYYLPGRQLHLPDEISQLPYSKQASSPVYAEDPAMATGNDCFTESPSFTDWYETVKLNYGVDYLHGESTHFEPPPDTWIQMRDILMFWAGKRIGGFRCDMVELVPLAFWQWCIPQIKERFPGLLFLAEVYKPETYQAYVEAGFDYLYDKAGLYDCLREVMAGKKPASAITGVWQSLHGLDSRMLRFLENHDEQRIASRHFAGSAAAGIPGMTLCATMHQNAVMVYFGQELGEAAEGESGFSGDDGRSSIFDYTTVPAFQKWFNKGRCDGGLSEPYELHIREFYRHLLQISQEEVVANGHFYDLMWANQEQKGFDPRYLYAYLRWKDETIWLVLLNFSKEQAFGPWVHIPDHFWSLSRIIPSRPFRTRLIMKGGSIEPEDARIRVSEQAVGLYIEPQSSVIVEIS